MKKARIIVATVSRTENMGDHGRHHEIPFPIDPKQSIQSLVDDWGDQYGRYVGMHGTDPMDRLSETATLTLRVIEVSEEWGQPR
jgi:hypothetical protein